jgi:hypothetical protein
MEPYLPTPILCLRWCSPPLRLALIKYYVSPQTSSFQLFDCNFVCSAHLLHACYIHIAYHFILHGLIALRIEHDECEVQVPYYVIFFISLFFLLGRNILFINLFLHTVNQCSSFKSWKKVTSSYETVCFIFFSLCIFRWGPGRWRDSEL